jgi:hypothetical protein
MTLIDLANDDDDDVVVLNVVTRPCTPARLLDDEDVVALPCTRSIKEHWTQKGDERGCVVTSEYKDTSKGVSGTQDRGVTTDCCGRAMQDASAMRSQSLGEQGMCKRQSCGSTLGRESLPALCINSVSLAVAEYPLARLMLDTCCSLCLKPFSSADYLASRGAATSRRLGELIAKAAVDSLQIAEARDVLETHTCSTSAGLSNMNDAILRLLKVR